MIVDRIIDYLESTGRKVPEDLLTLALARMERTLRRNLGEQRESKARSIGGSLSWYCPRRAYYQLTGAAGEKPSGRSRVAFLMGDTLQAVVDLLASLAGVEFAYPDADGKELEVRLPIEGVEVVGHIDHAVRTSKEGLVVGDTKSMATYTYRDFTKACSDPEAEWWKVERWGYVAQLRFYMWCVELLGLGTGERGFFIGIDKNTGHMAELWVARDPATIEVFKRAIPALEAARKRYFTAREAVLGTVTSNGGSLAEAEAAASAVPRNEANGLPARPVWARTIELAGANKRADGTKGRVLEVDTDRARTNGQGWRCNYCPFTAACWPGFDLVAMSDGPKWRKAIEGTAEAAPST